LPTFGFIGVGTIASAFIAGLRRTGNDSPIVLSPRSEARSVALATNFAKVRRAHSNAEVVADSDIVFLTMRPAQVEDALDGLRFRPDQTVVSFVTGLFLPDLAALAPDSQVARILPLPMIAEGQGPVICFPRNSSSSRRLRAGWRGAAFRWAPRTIMCVRCCTAWPWSGAPRPRTSSPA
jgi:pyrroline-5-carboxylate reductase